MSRLRRLADQLEQTASRMERDDDLERCDLEAFTLLARAAPREFSWTASRIALAVAAMILLGAIIWGGVSWLSGNGPPSPAGGRLLADARLSAFPEPARAVESPPVFHSGDRVYLHYSLRRQATVFVALLDSSGHLSPVSETAPRLPAGNHHVTLELDDETGVETLLVLASADELKTEDFLEAVDAARPQSLPDGPGEPDAAVRAITEALSARGPYEVRALTYSHEPNR